MRLFHDPDELPWWWGGLATGWTRSTVIVLSRPISHTHTNTSKTKANRAAHTLQPSSLHWAKFCVDGDRKRKKNNKTKPNPQASAHTKHDVKKTRPSGSAMVGRMVLRSAVCCRAFQSGGDKKRWAEFRSSQPSLSRFFPSLLYSFFSVFYRYVYIYILRWFFFSSAHASNDPRVPDFHQNRWGVKSTHLLCVHGPPPSFNFTRWRKKQYHKFSGSRRRWRTSSYHAEYTQPENVVIHSTIPLRKEQQQQHLGGKVWKTSLDDYKPIDVQRRTAGMRAGCHGKDFNLRTLFFSFFFPSFSNYSVDRHTKGSKGKRKTCSAIELVIHGVLMKLSRHLSCQTPVFKWRIKWAGAERGPQPFGRSVLFGKKRAKKYTN